MASNAPACEGCVARDLRCVDQVHGILKAEMVKKKNKAQQEQIELRSLISQILQKLPPNGFSAGGTKLEVTAVDVLKKLHSELLPPSEATAVESDGDSTNHAPAVDDRLPKRHDGFDKVPLLSIFSNDNLQQWTTENEPSASPFGNREYQVSERKSQVALALRAAAPNIHDLTVLFEADQVWQVWQSAFPEVKGTDIGGAGGNNIPCLLSRVSGVLESEDAIIIAKVLLCAAFCVQQLPVDFEFTQTSLPFNYEAIQNQFLTPVENLLSQDEGCACTLDGLQCMIMQTRIFINFGMPHKAWLVFRHAIGYAHLLGLHRQPSNSPEPLARRKRGLWMKLWHGERYLSLILGLPYSAADSSYDLAVCQSRASGTSNVEVLMLKLGIIAGKVIDRDQHPNGPDFLITMQIDQELEECKNVMPKHWWETEPGEHMPLAEIANMFSAKFTYQNIRKLLHLPFMLKSAPDPRYHFSRIAALEASREMIKYYRIMRDVDRPVFSECVLADFQVFTAAMVLLLNLLGQLSHSKGWPPSDQTESDWDIITSITNDLRRVAKAGSPGVASQASRMLDDLCQLRFSASDNGNKTYQASIPYFGKLTIRMGQAARAPSLEPTQEVQDRVSSPVNSAIGFDELFGDQIITFDRHFPLPDDDQPWQQMEPGWSGMPDFNLYNDWTWSLMDHEFDPN
jgi:hypothetical protein